MQLVLCAVSLALMCTAVNSKGKGCTRALKKCQRKYLDEVTTSAASDAHCVFAQHLIDCIFASRKCSFNKDCKQRIIEGTYSPLQDAGIDCDDECTVGSQKCSLKIKAMIADGTARIGNCSYIQKELDCQSAACPALTDDEKQTRKDNILTQLKKNVGIDCYNQCHVARKQCEDKFDEKIKDGTVEKLGWCQLRKDLLDCIFESECVFTEAEKLFIIKGLVDNNSCLYKL